MYYVELFFNFSRGVIPNCFAVFQKRSLYEMYIFSRAYLLSLNFKILKEI